MAPLLRLPAALLALSAAANLVAAEQEPVQVTFFSERDFGGVGITLNSTENCVSFPEELRAKVSSFHLKADNTDVRLWKGEMCTGDSKVWSAGGSKLIADVGKSMAKSTKSFSTCSTGRMSICRDMRGYIHGFCGVAEVFNLSYVMQLNRFLARTVYMAVARVVALSLENSYCGLCMGRKVSPFGVGLNRRSAYECSAPTTELAAASDAGAPPSKATTPASNLIITRTMTVVSLLVHRVRERPVGKRELHALYLVIVGRPPQAPHEEKILEEWVGISDVLDKNNNGLIEPDEVEELEVDGAVPPPADDVHRYDFVDLD